VASATIRSSSTRRTLSSRLLLLSVFSRRMSVPDELSDRPRWWNPYEPIQVPRSGASLQPLVVYTILAIDLAADGVGDRDHSLVVLENPADLGAFRPVHPDARTADVLDHHEGELAGHAAGLQPADDAHQRNAEIRRARLAQPPEQLDEVERKQPAL